MEKNQYLIDIALKREDIESFDQYPFNLNAVRTLHTLKIHPKVTYLIGENGSGKSTLLEAIAVALGFNPEGGTKNFNFTTRPSHSPLHQYLRVARGSKRVNDGYFFRAESFFNVASEIERLDSEPYGGNRVIDSYGGMSLHEQSHGESFLALMVNRFGGNGLYILDEPEAALSPQRQLAVLLIIHNLVLKDSQFLIATHSPILMAYPDACIYSFGPDGIVETTYEGTEHFLVTRDFLLNRERMLQMLFEGE